MIDAVTEQRQIMRVYAAFGAGLILSFVPLVVAALFSMALGFGVLIIAYVLRTDAEDGTLMENHMTFIIRTIWIGCLLSLVTLTLASFYMLEMLDQTPLMPCAEAILSAATGMMDPFGVKIFMESACWADYWQKNLGTFIISGAMVAVPVVLYFLVRYVRGVTRASRGYRVANPKAWF